MSALQRRLGKVVRRLREERGIAPEDFGDRAGLDLRILAGMERGDYTVYVENIEQIARGLGIASWELMRLAEEKTDQTTHRADPG